MHPTLCQSFGKSTGICPHDEITSVFDVLDEPELAEDASEDQQKARDRKLLILTWFMDECLGEMAGVEYWGPTIRP